MSIASAPVPHRPFHLAFPVHDLTVARAFYGGLLGCAEGRSSPEWVDFDLYGHQIVAHLAPHECQIASTSRVDGDAVPVKHFGVVLPMAEWQALATNSPRLAHVSSSSRMCASRAWRVNKQRCSSSTRRAMRWNSRPSPISASCSPNNR